jgi:hypothetical protein
MGGDGEAFRHRGLKSSLVREKSPAWQNAGLDPELTMKDLHQVLEQKKTEIERVRREIEALHFVIPLLAEDADKIENGLPSPVSQVRETGIASAKGWPRRDYQPTR